MDFRELEKLNCEQCKRRLDCLVKSEECFMSYIRYGQPLRWFKGSSTAYVYHGGSVVDYDNDYKDLPTLIELIGTFILRETGDDEYTEKMVYLLANLLNVEERLRVKRLTDGQLLGIYKQRSAAWKKKHRKEGE